jgi:hypothetical protein
VIQKFENELKDWAKTMEKVSVKVKRVDPSESLMSLSEFYQS